MSFLALFAVETRHVVCTTDGMFERGVVRIVSLLALTCVACGGQSGTTSASAGSGGAGGGPTEETPRPVLTIRRLAYGNGRYVATGHRDGEDSVIYTSSNGSDWEQLLDLKAYGLGEVAFGNGRFVMLAGAGVENVTLVSEDGLSWRGVPSDGLRRRGIAFGNGVFISLGVQQVMRTTDGETWEVFETGVDDYDVAFARGAFYKWGDRLQSLSLSATGEEWASAAVPPELVNASLYHAFGSKDGLVGWMGGPGYERYSRAKPTWSEACSGS